MDSALEDKICELYDLYVEVPIAANILFLFTMRYKFWHKISLIYQDRNRQSEGTTLRLDTVGLNFRGILKSLCQQDYEHICYIIQSQSNTIIIHFQSPQGSRSQFCASVVFDWTESAMFLPVYRQYGLSQVFADLTHSAMSILAHT